MKLHHDKTAVPELKAAPLDDITDYPLNNLDVLRDEDGNLWMYVRLEWPTPATPRALLVQLYEEKNKQTFLGLLKELLDAPCDTTEGEYGPETVFKAIQSRSAPYHSEAPASSNRELIERLARLKKELGW